MIGHRDGARILMCDGCYRPKRTGEPGWTRATVTRPYRSPDEVMTDAPATHTLMTNADYCPTCRPAAAESP